MLAFYAEIVNGDHISMNKSRCCSSLVMKLRRRMPIVHEFRPYHFNGDRPVECVIDSCIYSTHASGTDAPVQSVASRKKPGHVNTDQAGLVLIAAGLSDVETRATLRAFLITLFVRLLHYGTC